MVSHITLVHKPHQYHPQWPNSHPMFQIFTILFLPSFITYIFIWGVSPDKTTWQKCCQPPCQKRITPSLLEQLCLLNSTACVGSIKDLKADISNLIHQEELFWRQRSRSIWLPTGDKNTKYFHNCASQHWRKNHISGIFDNEGRWCTSIVRISQVVEAYFQDLFSSAQPDNIESVFNSVESHVMPQMNESLTQRYTSKEIQTTLFQMHPSKSLGPDGMSPFFFQKYWHIVGTNVMNAVLSVLHFGHMLKKWTIHILFYYQKRRT